jgi:hypothetical protein
VVERDVPVAAPIFGVTKVSLVTRASVPEVGSVTPVAPVTVSVVAKLPEIVSVDAALFAMPVPPCAAAGHLRPRVRGVHSCRFWPAVEFDLK